MEKDLGKMEALEMFYLVFQVNKKGSYFFP